MKGNTFVGRPRYATQNRLSFLVIPLVLFLQTNARAVVSVQFSPATNYPCSAAGSLAVGDFNNDGKMDIVTMDYSFGHILFGKGGGRFSDVTDRPVQNASPNVVATGDFNNDGASDFVTGFSYGGCLLLGTNNNTFAQTNFIWSSSAYPQSVTVGDFNADGNPDIAQATGSGSSFVSVGFGRGNGAFDLPTNYVPASFVYSADIVSGDVTGDGRLDLAVSLNNFSNSHSNSVCILTNRGDGVFGILKYYTADPGDTHGSLLLGDFNGDGLLDLAVLDYNAMSVTIRLNLKHGDFGPARVIPLGFHPSSIVSADFNGDGQLDLVVRGGPDARILPGNGDGTFGLGDLMTVPTDNFHHTTVAVGDFDGNGTPDLAFADSNGGSIAIMLNQTPPTLQITRMPGYNQISWRDTFGAGFALEYTTNLAGGDWQPFPYPPVVFNSQKAVADWADRGQVFYRLRK